MEAGYGSNSLSAREVVAGEYIPLAVVEADGLGHVRAEVPGQPAAAAQLMSVVDPGHGTVVGQVVQLAASIGQLPSSSLPSLRAAAES